MIDLWPSVVLILGSLVAYCFTKWLDWRRETEKGQREFQMRAFVLEERKFDVWKTMNFAQVSTQGKDAKSIVERALRGAPTVTDVEPDPQKVVSMFDKKRERGPHSKASVNVEGVGLAVTQDEGPADEQRIMEIAEAMVKATEIPPGPQRDAFLKQHGIDHAEFPGD